MKRMIKNSGVKTLLHTPHSDDGYFHILTEGCKEESDS
jgi:hypothetical protein